MYPNTEFLANPDESSKKMQDRVKENPLESLDHNDLYGYVKDLFNREFKGKDSVTEEELIVGARLASSNYANHERRDGNDSDQVESTQFTPSIETVTPMLGPHDWRALDIQKSKEFWKEPKALLVTLVVCCMAPLVQGWNQAANGNMGWPKDFNVDAYIIDPEVRNAWTFGGVNAALWFAAMLGPAVVDPVCNATRFAAGRRGSVMAAAILSLIGTIVASYSQNWQQLLGARIVLGVGIGAKASSIPIWESEILPPAKRGRVLVSWQVFVAVGLLTGNGAAMYFRDAADGWRYQVLSGALPALILLILVYMGCESPRWLIVREKYVDAFETLVQLRKERLLAAEEFCYTYFQIQAERAAARNNAEPDFGTYQNQISYWARLWQLVTLVRNRRALFATLIVMMTQHLSGINIFAILGTTFYTASNLERNDDPEREWKNLKLNAWFAAVTVGASSIAYFLVEPLPVDSSLDNLAPGVPQATTAKGRAKQERRRRALYRRLRGRKQLLLISLLLGMCVLGALAGVLSKPGESEARSREVLALVLLLALFYSPGVGAVPFLYSAEVWPNEARDVGMSVGVFVNFFGAGMLALVVPLALVWSPAKLVGIFTGLSAFGLILVYLFVPCTDEAVSLEEMSAIFDNRLGHHARNQAIRPFQFLRRNKQAAPATYPVPMQQLPRHSHPAPQMGSQPYYSTSPTQYAPYGSPQQQSPYEVPQFTPVLPQMHYDNSSPHRSLHDFGPQKRFGGGAST